MSNEAGLAETLRLATAKIHLEAERSGYIRDILRKTSSREGYGLFLRNLEPTYAALERGLSEKAGHGALNGFDWPKLYRHEAITGDLSALSETSWQDAFSLLPEGLAYAERIERVTAEAPHRLLGHAYARYIGDLSGGRLVKAILENVPGLEANQLGFYDFDDIEDADAFKARFREKLDNVGEQTDCGENIVDEALIAFQLNIDMSIAVQAVMSTGSR